MIITQEYTCRRTHSSKRQKQQVNVIRYIGAYGCLYLSIQVPCAIFLFVVYISKAAIKYISYTSRLIIIFVGMFQCLYRK